MRRHAAVPAPHALHDAPDPHRLLTLGYASILASWALLNSGPPEAGYGYWFPGPENDGGAGGGFEPAPYGTTWLGQPHARGAWFYSCESDLGFGGFLRAAATVLVEDPVFGTYAYGGSCEDEGGTWKVLCRDGVRRRFHAILGTTRAHLELERDHIAADAPVVLDRSLRRISFVLESPTAAPHRTGLRIAGLLGPAWRIRVDGAPACDADLGADREARIDIPVERMRIEVTLEAR